MTDFIESIRNRGTFIPDQLVEQMSKKQIEDIVHFQSICRTMLAKKLYKKKLKRKEKRKFIIMELEKTEKDYLFDTKIVLNNVMNEVKEWLDQQMFNMLFINLEEIIGIHDMFYEKMKQLFKDYNHNTTKISELILYLTPRLKQPYYKFCLQYSKSNQILRLLNISNTQFKNHIQNLKKEGIIKGELASYLIKPVQRICKYSLLLRELIKYTDNDHCDYSQLEVANESIKNIVQETNDKIEEFLCQERMSQLTNVFKDLEEENNNRYIIQCQANLIEKQNDQQRECDVFIFTKFIIISKDKKEILRHHLDQNSSVKDTPTGKYFKNIIMVISKKNILTLSSKNVMKKNQLLEGLQKTIGLIQNRDEKRVEVDILGAEERDTLFAKHTLYIVRIKTRDIDMKIYPRFSELIEIENEIRKQIPHMEMPHLEKSGWYKTKKTKTIEKRMFIIKDFLVNILNDPKVRNVASVFTKIGLEILLETSIKKHQDLEGNTISIVVNIANYKTLNIWIPQKSRILDLKHKIVELWNLSNPEQYEIFEMRDKRKKLLYEDQIVTKVIKDSGGFFSKIFDGKIQLVFHRYYYLPFEQEYELYQKDKVRQTLELSIIRSQIIQYNLDYQLLLTILAFYANLQNVVISNDEKIKTFLSSSKSSSQDYLIFRQYCYQIQDVIIKQPSTPISIFILKAMQRAQLYKCSQYYVQPYPKTLKQVKKQIPVQQNMILGIKPTKILFLNQQRSTIYTLEYTEIKQLLIYPTSLVFIIDRVKSEVRFNTIQSFEICKLIDIYSKTIQTKHFDYRTSIQ